MSNLQPSDEEMSEDEMRNILRATGYKDDQIDTLIAKAREFEASDMPPALQRLALPGHDGPQNACGQPTKLVVITVG